VNASKHVNSTARNLRIVREESLRQRLRARDEQALVELIDQALPWMLGVAEGILHDVAEAEEVTMDAFRKLWDRIETVADNGSGLMPWLLRATRNRAIDRLRARARRIDGAAAAAVDLDEIPGGDATSVASTASGDFGGWAQRRSADFCR
jgi:RNA polymerase sigma-70 factor (ECF subfamily)